MKHHHQAGVYRGDLQEFIGALSYSGTRRAQKCNRNAPIHGRPSRSNSQTDPIQSYVPNLESFLQSVDGSECFANIFTGKSRVLTPIFFVQRRWQSRDNTSTWNLLRSGRRGRYGRRRGAEGSCGAAGAGFMGGGAGMRGTRDRQDLVS